MKRELHNDEMHILCKVPPFFFLGGLDKIRKVEILLYNKYIQTKEWVSVKTVTINDTATTIIFLYILPEGYRMGGLEELTVHTVQAACRPLEGQPGKLATIFTAVAEEPDDLLSLPEIPIPEMDADVDLARAEALVRRQVAKVLKKTDGKEGRVSEVLERSFCCATILLDVPASRAGRGGVQLFVWCFFDEKGYLASYYLQIDSQSKGPLQTLEIAASEMTFDGLKEIVLHMGKQLTRKGFADEVSRLEKPVLFPGETEATN